MQMGEVDTKTKTVFAENIRRAIGLHDTNTRLPDGWEGGGRGGSKDLDTLK